MPVAQIIRFDERQAIGRPRRKPERQPTCIVLLFPAHSRQALPAAAGIADDDDRCAGRGRDPG
ncbi:MAG TPA: hypothetical protein VJT13_22825 [Xanthobacteraceae bacterium]|nr:hypothetical protein [Xanthobacteraceae bacterium]